MSTNAPRKPQVESFGEMAMSLESDRSLAPVWFGQTLAVGSLIGALATLSLAFGLPAPTAESSMPAAEGSLAALQGPTVSPAALGSGGRTPRNSGLVPDDRRLPVPTVEFRDGQLIPIGRAERASEVEASKPIPLVKRTKEFEDESTRQDSASRNQELAVSVVKALGEAGLTSSHFIDVEVLDGIATISGAVADSKQRANVTRIASQVEGIDRVVNRLAIKRTEERSR